MWIAVGVKTNKFYMMSNTKSGLFLRLQQKYKSTAQNDETYPEPLMIQRIA